MLLHCADLLQGLPDNVITLLSEKAQSHSFQKGQVIINENDKPEPIFLIVEGADSMVIKFNDGTQSEAAHLGAGNSFGILDLLSDDTEKTQFIAITDSQVLEIKKEHSALLLKDHPFVVNFMKERFSKRQEGIKKCKQFYQAQQESEKISFTERIERLFK